MLSLCQSVSLIQIKILQATGLPQYLSNFVFCQYSFWDQSEPIIVAPEVDTSSSSPSTKDPYCMVVFDSCKVKGWMRSPDMMLCGTVLLSLILCSIDRANYVKTNVGAVCCWYETDFFFVL